MALFVPVTPRRPLSALLNALLRTFLPESFCHLNSAGCLELFYTAHRHSTARLMTFDMGVKLLFCSIDYHNANRIVFKIRFLENEGNQNLQAEGGEAATGFLPQKVLGGVLVQLEHLHKQQTLRATY